MPAVNEPGDPNDEALVTSGLERLAEDEATAERVEVELAATPWAAYLGGVAGLVELSTADQATLRGRVQDAGDGWCVLRTPEGRHWLVMTGHVVTAAASQLRATPVPVVQRGPGFVLRRWARSRIPVCCFLVNGQSYQGIISAVLSDAVVLTVGSDRRVLLPLTALTRVLGESLIE